MKKNLVEKIILILVFLSIMFFHILNIQTKSYMGMSEFFSIAVSNVAGFFDKNYNKKFEGIYTGEELRQEFLVGKTNDMLSDIKTQYFNHLDPTHSNLYYSMLRISLFNLKSVDLNYLIFRGTILNLLCLIIAFFFMYKLLSQIYEDKIFVSLALFIAFSSRGLLTNISRIREYSLQLLLIVVFTYCLYGIYKQIKLGTFENLKKSIIHFSLITALTFLTGYFSLIYIFWSYLFLAVRGTFTIRNVSESSECHTRQQRHARLAGQQDGSVGVLLLNKEVLKFIVMSFVFSIFWVFLICPHFALGFLSTNSELMILHSLKDSLLCVFKMCNELIFYTKPFVFQFICVLLLLLAIKNWYNLKSKKNIVADKNDEFVIISFIISCLYLLVITLLNPKFSKSFHRQYTLMVMPFLSLIIPYICVRFKYKKCLILVFCIMFFVNAMKMCRLSRFVKLGLDCASIKKENKYDILIKNKNKKVQIISCENCWYEPYFTIMNFDKSRKYIVNSKNVDTKNAYIIFLSVNPKNNRDDLKVLLKQPNQISIYESND